MDYPFLLSFLGRCRWASPFWYKKASTEAEANVNQNQSTKQTMNFLCVRGGAFCTLMSRI